VLDFFFFGGVSAEGETVGAGGIGAGGTEVVCAPSIEKLFFFSSLFS
jgi:hypothetical protein